MSMFTVAVRCTFVKDIPSCLLSLTVDDINTLRPFYLYFEQYERKSHGYQVKCCPIKLRTSEQSVKRSLAVQNRKWRHQYCTFSQVFTSSFFRHKNLLCYILAVATSISFRCCSTVWPA